MRCHATLIEIVSDRARPIDNESPYGIHELYFSTLLFACDNLALFCVPQHEVEEQRPDILLFDFLCMG